MITCLRDDNTAVLTGIIECNWLRLMTDVYRQIRKDGGWRREGEGRGEGERMVHPGRGRKTAAKGVRGGAARGAGMAYNL